MVETPEADPIEPKPSERAVGTTCASRSDCEWVKTSTVPCGAETDADWMSDCTVVLSVMVPSDTPTEVPTNEAESAPVPTPAVTVGSYWASTRMAGPIVGWAVVLTAAPATMPARTWTPPTEEGPRVVVALAPAPAPANDSLRSAAAATATASAEIVGVDVAVTATGPAEFTVVAAGVLPEGGLSVPM